MGTGVRVLIVGGVVVVVAALAGVGFWTMRDRRDGGSGDGITTATDDSDKTGDASTNCVEGEWQADLQAMADEVAALIPNAIGSGEGVITLTMNNGEMLAFFDATFTLTSSPDGEVVMSGYTTMSGTFTASYTVSDGVITTTNPVQLVQTTTELIVNGEPTGTQEANFEPFSEASLVTTCEGDQMSFLTGQTKIIWNRI